MQLIPWKQLLGAVIVISTAFPILQANATPIVVDFTDVVNTGLLTSNFVSKGVQFSPNCHQHIQNVEAHEDGTDVPASGGNWLGFDPSGCGSVFNPDYLGPDVGLPGKMFVALVSGQTFNFLSFDFVRMDGGTANIDIYSSRGGFFALQSVGYGYAPYSFSGDAWTNLDWVVFSEDESSSTAGFDNLTLERVVGQVPEPGSSAAWLALAAALITFRRARQRF